MRSPCRMLLLLLSVLAASLQAQSWYAVQGRHALACSEGNSRAAREAVRRADLAVSLFAEIFHRKDVVFSAPLVIFAGALPPSAPVHAPMAVYLTVDPAQPESMTQLVRDVAALALDDNYPRAMPWFDSGLISYLQGARFSAEQVELGVPPQELAASVAELGRPEAPAWIPFTRLMSVQDPAELTPAERRIFEAESWALLRWIVDSNRMAQAGEYLTAFAWRGVASEDAARDAFSLGLGELEKAVRESLSSAPTTEHATPNTTSLFYAERKLPSAEARTLRIAPRLFAASTQDSALQEMLALMREQQDSAIVHRTLAWAFLSHHDLANAMEHVRRALALDDSDPAMHYLYALLTNEGDTRQIHSGSAVPRLATELKDALRRDPYYAAAYELLGLAQLNDGQLRPALQNLQRASVLRPREGLYSLNLVRAYAANGNQEAARNLAGYLHRDHDQELAAEAERVLQEPQETKKSRRMFGSVPIPPENSAGRYDNLPEAIAADEAEEKAGQAPAHDERRTEHLRGNLLRVECAGEGAWLEIAAAGETWHIRVPERSRAVLLGARAIDCAWHSIRVAVNLKLNGERAGDLVSLELVTGK